MDDKNTQTMLVGCCDESDAEAVAHEYTLLGRSDDLVLSEMKRVGVDRFHAEEDHNYLIKKVKKCLYCEMFPSSKPVPRSQIKEMLK